MRAPGLSSLPLSPTPRAPHSGRGLSAVGLGKSLLILGAATALLGCDSATSGALGRVSFTPEHCGLPFGFGCDFDRGVVDGSTVDIYIEGKEGFSSAGLDLVSETPQVAGLEVIADLDGRPAWRIRGLRAGRAEIAAIDRDDAVVDYLRFDVRTPNYGFHLDSSSSLEGPATNEPGYDEVWQLRGRRVDLRLLSYDRGDAMMGEFDFDVMLSNEFNDVDLKGDLRKGEIEFSALQGGLGPFDMHFTDPQGVVFRARIE